MFKKNNFDLKPVKKAKVTFADEIESLLKEGGGGVKKEEEEDGGEKMEIEEKTEIKMRFQNDELDAFNKLSDEKTLSAVLRQDFPSKTFPEKIRVLITPSQGIKFSGKKTFRWMTLLGVPTKDEDKGITETDLLFDSKDGTFEFDLNTLSYDVALLVGEFLTVISPCFFKDPTFKSAELILEAWESKLSTGFGTSLYPVTALKPEGANEEIKQRLTDCMGAIFSLMQASEVVVNLEKRDPAKFDKYNLPRYEQEYEEELIKIAASYEQQILNLNQIVKNAIALNNGEDEIIGEEPAGNENQNEDQRNSQYEPGIAGLLKYVSITVSKLHGELKELTKVKKERAELRSEVEKLRRQLASSSVSSTSSTPSSSSSQDKEVKKVYETMLPTALREVMSKLHSYRFVLDLAGKIHVRSEQTMFLFDVLDLVRTYAQKNISLYKDISSVNMDVVKSDVESILSTNVTAFASDARTPDEVLKKVLVPVYLSALENSFLDVQKFTPVKPPTLKTLLIRGKTSERLIGAFINYVAAKYTSDLQIQKNMATTASDKIVQSVAKLQAMQDLKEALKSAGYY